MSWTWTATWLRHYGGGVMPRFAVVERRGEPIGVALLVVAPRGSSVFPARCLHLGTAGEQGGSGIFVEYNDLLCAEADRPVVAAALAGAVRELPGWDELDAPGFRASTAAELGRVLPLELRERASWTIRLSPDHTVLDGMAGAHRRLVRQARETLRPGPPELVADPARATALLAELGELHQARWTAAGRPGAFADPRFRGFLGDLSRAWVAEGRVGLYRLPDEDGATLGCVVGFVEQGRFLYYQAGFRQFTDNRKRAGLLCHAEFAEHCRERGLHEYELLAGDARFKRQLSAGEHNTLVWGRWARPSLRNRGRHVARGAVRTLRAAAARAR